ncbi:MAG: BRCT domain-containing protein [Akkermansiaceae bacterium]|nr:BRCT domain-containing protein [Akkermansiaceae bacterium]
MNASNRQLKLLNFFSIPFSPKISQGAAGWEIANLMWDEANRERWERYVIFTGDMGGENTEILPYTEEDLLNVVVPEGKTTSDIVRAMKHELVELEIANGSPFDIPEPEVEFQGKLFVFTGAFEYGSRKKCIHVTEEKGGIAPADGSVTNECNYLVIGEKGSSSWSHGKYGRKIEAAITKRRENGVPAIISEQHWVKAVSNR